MFLKLNQTLGSSYEANQDDVYGAKTALAKVGEYTPPPHGINDWTDDALFDGMRRFQEKNDLQVDGVARPGGPTETALNAAMAKGRSRVVPASQGMRGAAPRAAPRIFDVSSEVGVGRENRSRDVQGAKRTLAWAGYYPKDKAQAATGELDEDLDWGLRGFQRDFGLARDGYMAPNGETVMTLDALVAPLVRAAFAGDAARTEEAPSDGRGGSDGRGDQQEPDTEFGRSCAEYQRQRDAWTADLAKWTEEMLFLNNNDITSLEGTERSRYLSLTREYSGFAEELDTSASTAEPPRVQIDPSRNRDDKDEDRGGRRRRRDFLDILDKLGDILDPTIEEADRRLDEEEWQDAVRVARDEAVTELNQRREQANRNIQRIIREASDLGCFSENNTV